ncbi:MAG: OmpA family protein [Alphaproteobacteria bacterium]|nr:MAG: OmpA family protein [Alphaproteobacteria bacterium]
MKAPARALAFAALLGAAAPAPGAPLQLPANAVLQAEAVEAAGLEAIAIGPWQAESGSVPVQELSGRVEKRAWRIGGTALTTGQLMQMLREQLVADGFEVRFECETAQCGGFDFRYGIDVIGEPDMHVNLGDFQFLSARKPGEEGAWVSILVSRTASAAYVQVVSVGKAGAVAAPAPAVPSTKAAPESDLARAPEADVGAMLEQSGHYVLSDLTFETGSADLGPGRFESLSRLAEYLIAHPDKRVVLVGHTDAEGSLEGNISLSKRRASSVRERLVTEYGVPENQLEAEGIGYLAPIASNQSGEGRRANRRVEAVLLSSG